MLLGGAVSIGGNAGTALLGGDFPGDLGAEDLELL